VNASKVSIITILVALCIATNYALAGVPNVKAMDFLVFVGGFCFGPLAGALIGIISWVVYGVLNPYGFVLQVWLATIFSESIYGLFGGFLGKSFASTNFSNHHLTLSILFGTVAFILTLIYDLITTVVYAPMFGVPILIAIIVGIPFTVLHEFSNAIIFGVSSVPIITRLEKLLGGDRFGISKK
jgi:energy-coupling factor transport system substrate-specific component